ncbi:MAG: hypothetical protein WA975_04990 [Mesorhizobium sp.]
MARKHDRKGHSPGGEHWTKLIRRTMEEPAWRALSSTAQALYPWLKLEWRGLEYNNNGKLRLSTRQAASRLGVRPDTAAEAFRDLQRKGFIVQTEHACLGVDGAAKSPAYEITELKMPGTEGDGRKLYRDWKPGSDFAVASSGANNPTGNNGQKTKPCHGKRDGAVTETVTKGANPVMKTVTACPENRDESGYSANEIVTESVTSLSYHNLAAVSGPQRQPVPNSGQAARALSKADKRTAVKDLLRSAVAGMTLPGGEHG